MSSDNQRPVYPMPLPAKMKDGAVIASDYVTGISLREDYAGAALVAFIGQGPNSSAWLGATGLATKAVEYADALIAELGK